MTEERKRIIAELDHIRSYFEAKADMCIGNGKMLLLSWANAARDAAQMLEAQEPRVLTLEEVRGSCGSGWVEEWYMPDPEEGEEEYKDIREAAWCKGNLVYSDGDVTSEDYLGRQYMKQYGMRIWNARPTEEQREKEKWE